MEILRILFGMFCFYSSYWFLYSRGYKWDLNEYQVIGYSAIIATILVIIEVLVETYLIIPSL